MTSTKIRQSTLATRHLKNWLAAMPRRPHPIPFRIRSLSSSGPMVVITQVIARVGRCQPLFSPVAQTMGENEPLRSRTGIFQGAGGAGLRTNLTAAPKELPFLFSAPDHSDSSRVLPLRHPTPSSAGVASPVRVWPPIPRKPAGGVGALAPRPPLAKPYY